ncbi:hypothetical protein ACFDTO_03640 [Microbacteriaceae bacterium 4G12]
MTAGVGSPLEREATRVLAENWRGLYTVPAGGLYPHQWSWDSAFIAIGTRHLSPRRAQQEIESLLGAQWADGRLPQIVFTAGRDDDYSPGPSFWRSERIPGSAPVPTAGLIQPPNHAWAALLVHEADPAESRRRGFLERAYPRLAAWHAYLRARRTGASGLVHVLHPWESGMDNSPLWDAPLAAVVENAGADVPRPDLRHAHASERPSNAEYGRYLALAARYRDHDCDDTDEGFPFRVEDPAVSALLVRSELALAEIARELGAHGERGDHEDRAARLTASLESLWHEALGTYVARDLVSGRLQPHRTVSGLVPLLVPGLAHAEQLLGLLRGERFGLGLGRAVLVPSADLTADTFDVSRYWRGPSWFNTAWLIARALEERGLADEARALARDACRHALSSDFAEYLHPHTGEPRGTRRFSWTAALALDLLRAHPA